VYRLRSSQNQLVTLQVLSSVDTYLYIIDPRSIMPAASMYIPNPTTYPSLFDGKSYANDAVQIDKILDADVDYFVVVAGKNLATAAGKYTLQIQAQ